MVTDSQRLAAITVKLLTAVTIETVTNLYITLEDTFLTSDRPLIQCVTELRDFCNQLNIGSSILSDDDIIFLATAFRNSEEPYILNQMIKLKGEDFDPLN